MAIIERGPSLTEQAADALRARIVSGDFQLGASLSEISLAADLGVSKTPVREALMQLRRDGLVEVLPQRGTFVFSMTAEQVEMLSELRGILESAALRIVMATCPGELVERWAEIVAAMEEALRDKDARLYRELDGLFHRAFIELAGNAYLLDAFNTIAFRVQALRNRLSLDAELNSHSYSEHVAMFAHARAGEATALLGLLERHIGWTRDHYVAALAPPAGAARRGRSRPVR